MATRQDSDLTPVRVGGQFWQIAKAWIVVAIVLFACGVFAAVSWFGATPVVATQVLFIPVALAGVRFGPGGGAGVGMLSAAVVWLAEASVAPASRTG